MKSHPDLQPWLDYFQMLHTYEEHGFLQIEAEKHEAYITRAALLTLANYTFGIVLAKDAMEKAACIYKVAHRIHAYANYLTAAAEGRKIYETAIRTDPEGPAGSHPVWLTDEIQKRTRAITERVRDLSFALHVVKEDGDHDPYFTLLITQRRSWRHPFRKGDHLEWITY